MRTRPPSLDLSCKTEIFFFFIFRCAGYLRPGSGSKPFPHGRNGLGVTRQKSHRDRASKTASNGNGAGSTYVSAAGRQRLEVAAQHVCPRRKGGRPSRRRPPTSLALAPASCTRARRRACDVCGRVLAQPVRAGRDDQDVHQRQLRGPGARPVHRRHLAPGTSPLHPKGRAHLAGLHPLPARHTQSHAARRAPRAPLTSSALPPSPVPPLRRRTAA